VAPRRILLILLAVVAISGACTGGKKDIAAQGLRLPAPTTTTAPKPVEYRQLAWASGPRVDIFQAPGAATPVGTLKNPTAEKQPLAFLAIGEQPDWLQVRLPVRPNGAVGWVRASDVRMGAVQAYRILVEVGAQRLTLFKGDEIVMQEPVGVGKDRTPTPLGNYFVDAMVKLDNPNTVWGPYQMSVSGFSNVLERFMGGVGQIAIHGTNAPQLIPGTISNGCVRMKNASISKLASLTGIGTPVDIVA
jgi:lipoprotein-anchoring transpeptidase ErfK/SrfK